MSSPRATWLASAAALAAFGLATPAAAQLGASLTVATDYRLRGFSLTDRRGAVTLAATYDHSSGAYAGGTLILHDPSSAGVSVLGHMAYLGFAAGKPGGPTYDIGVNHVELTLRYDRKIPVTYDEVYMGVAKGDWSARLSLARDYPRKGRKTAYLDLNGAVRPAEAWRFFCHAGAGVYLGDLDPGEERQRFDLQAGVAREFDRGEVFLMGTAVVPRPKPYGSGSEAGVSLGATLYF